MGKIVKIKKIKTGPSTLVAALFPSRTLGSAISSHEPLTHPSAVVLRRAKPSYYLPYKTASSPPILYNIGVYVASNPEEQTSVFHRSIPAKITKRYLTPTWSPQV